MSTLRILLSIYSLGMSCFKTWRGTDPPQSQTRSKFARFSVHTSQKIRKQTGNQAAHRNLGKCAFFFFLASCKSFGGFSELSMTSTKD